jgi:hypothetical protein
MHNHWINLPQAHPFVLHCDAPAINAFNATAAARHRFDLSLLPEPYFGSLDAPETPAAKAVATATVTEAHARQAFEALRAALPSDAYTVASRYQNSAKIEIQRTFGSPKVVLVWSANGLSKSELTTRSEYADRLGQWFPGLNPERSKPQYSRTFSVSAERLHAIVTENTQAIAAAILSVDASR